MSTRDTRWHTLAVLAVAQFMLILDVTIVNVALPSIAAELAMSTAALPWVVSAYALTFGGLLILGGRLADRFGPTKMIFAGLAVFTLASAAAGLSGTAGTLLAARALQGLGAALLSPAALSLVSTMFEGRDRHRALGVWAALGAVGVAVGVLVGGLLAGGPGWSWAFLINVPVGIIAAAGLVHWRPQLSPNSPHRTTGRPDVLGAIAITATVGLLVYG
ncbi:MAG: MFS transporter, partial [Jiangellaceae bacterium]